MINHGDNIIVGLSGGADSVSLAHFLANYNERNNVNVIAAHVNHCIRGEEADRDEEFVKNFCEKLGIDLYVKRVDIKRLAKDRGVGLEECGRTERYKYFNELCEKFGGKIATAHTLSDSEETVILNMTRGCGLKGLCGIPPVRKNIIRPLIFVSRDEIEKYCQKNKLSFVTDSTNLTEDYTRNKIRINVVPVLKNINEMFDNTFRRMIFQNIEEESYLDELAQEKFNKAKLLNGYDIECIKPLKSVIKNRVVKKILEDYCPGEIESKHIEYARRIIDDAHGAVTLPCDVNIYVNGTKLSKRESRNEKVEWEHKFFNTNVLTESGRRFIIKIFPINEYKELVKNGNLINYVSLDSDKIPKNSVFRNRRQGDVFCQAGRGLTKKVKKLFNEIKIPEENRNKIVMLASGSNVIWIDGIGICEDCKVRGNTKFVTVIRREHTDD